MNPNPDPQHLIPAHVTDATALALLEAAADQRGWQCVVWSRHDADAALPHSGPGTPDHRLTDEQWDLVRATSWWKAIAELAVGAIRDQLCVVEALMEAGVMCTSCSGYRAAVDAKPGMCDACADGPPSDTAPTADPDVTDPDATDPERRT